MAQDELDVTKELIKVEQHKLTELKAVDPELDVKLAQFQLERGQVQLRQARQDVEEHVLKAPTDGIVLRVQAQEGDLVGPTSPRPAVWLAPGGWIVRAEVSQEFAGDVREGLEVQVEDEASPRAGKRQDRRGVGLVPAAPPVQPTADERQYRPHPGVCDRPAGGARPTAARPARPGSRPHQAGDASGESGDRRSDR